LLLAALGLAVAGVCFVPTQALAQELGFTYQAQVQKNGLNVNGPCTFRFRIFGSESGQDQLAEKVQIVAVTDGLATAHVGFGNQGPFSDDNLWLEVALDCADGVPTPLTPRQRLVGLSLPPRVAAIEARLAAHETLVDAVISWTGSAEGFGDAFQGVSADGMRLTNKSTSNLTAKLPCAGRTSSGEVCPMGVLGQIGVAFEVVHPGVYEACVELNLNVEAINAGGSREKIGVVRISETNDSNEGLLEDGHEARLLLSNGNSLTVVLWTPVRYCDTFHLERGARTLRLFARAGTGCACDFRVRSPAAWTVRRVW
jgi:hypothetical protein